MKNEIPLILYHADYYHNGTTEKNCTIMIKEGRICKITKEENKEPEELGECNYIDCSGYFITPGFIDSHLHFPGDFLYRRFGIYLASSFSLEEYLKCIAKVDQSGVNVIRGYGWNHEVMNALPDLLAYKQMKAELDRLFPETMVALFSDDYHSCICNQALIKRYHPVKKYEYPLFETGLLEEEDVFSLPKQLPELKFSEEEIRASILLFQELLLENGITSAQSLMFLGGDHHTEWEVLKELDAHKELHINVNLALNVHPEEEFEDILKRFQQLQAYQTERIKVNTIKIYIDGVIENRSAYLYEPYENSMVSGSSLWKKEKLFEFCSYFDKKNIQIHVHSIGDAGLHLITEALCHAMDLNNTKNSRRHVVTHLQLAQEEDIKKMGEYGIIGCIQPYWIPKDEVYYPIDVRNIGDRVKEEYKAGSLIRNDVILTASSDSPVTQFPNPLIGIVNAAFRKNKKERVSIKDILDAFTKNGAYQLFRENETGRIEEGYAADIVLLSNNILEVTEPVLNETKILMTISNGRLVNKRV